MTTEEKLEMCRRALADIAYILETENNVASAIDWATGTYDLTS